MGITWNRAEIVTTRIEFAIDSPADIADLGKLEAIVWRDYCKTNDVDPETATRWDNWCKVEARDDVIVFVYAVDRKAKPDA